MVFRKKCREPTCRFSAHLESSPLWYDEDAADAALPSDSVGAK